MAAIMAEGGTELSEREEGKGEIQFVDSLNTLGTKLLVYQNHRFHRKGTTEKSTYFRCTYANKWGCPASVILYNFDLEEYTFEGFAVGKGQHRGHPKEEAVRERGGGSGTLKNCRHICLFCFADLTPEYWKMTALENVVPYGDSLSITLCDPVKNVQAFELLCNRLGVLWRKSKEGQNFDQTRILPLCFKCQCLYQEMFQLHLQVKQLEELVGHHARVIKGKIEKAERQSQADLVMGGTQLTILGLDVFRQKVVACEDTRADKCTKSKESKGPDSSGPAAMDTSIPPIMDLTDCVKLEVIPQPDVNFEDDTSNDLLNLLLADSPDNSPAISPDMEDSDFGSGGNPDAASAISASDSEPEEEVKTRARSARVLARKEKDADDDDGGEYVPSEEDSSEEENKGDDRDSDNDFNGDDSDDSDFEVTPRKSPRTRGLSRTPTPSKTKKSVSGLSKVSKGKIPTTMPSSYASKKEYVCHICSAIEIGYAAFLGHYDAHHPEENRYTCKFCQRHFKCLRDCVVHQRKHTGERPFPCPSCSSAFTSKKSLTSHVFHNHTDRSDMTYSCPECKKEFRTRSKLINHRISVHDHAPKKYYRKSGKPTRSWACHLCDKVIFGRGPFIQHYLDVHPEENRYTCKFCQRHFRDHRDCIRHQRKHTGEKPFPCSNCDKAFRDQKTLRGHIRNYHSETREPHICPKCGKQYSSKSALTGHLNVHNEFLLFCKSCGGSFRNASSFCKHNRRAHNGQAEHSEPISDPTAESIASLGMEIQNRTKCHICWEPVLGKIFLKKHFEEQHPAHQGGVTTCKCGKKFLQYKECLKHAIRHSTHKTYQCDQCPLTFFTGTELRVHSARHAPLEERKCNVCDICGMKLVSPAALAKHKKKHEDNPLRWVCEECGKDYAEKKGLNHHKKTEHLKILPFKCSHVHCGRAFALNADLVKHLRSHTGAKPFPCPHCDKSFPYTSSRARHIREVHRIGEDDKNTWIASRRKRTKKEKGAGVGTTAEVKVDKSRAPLQPPEKDPTAPSSSSARGTFGDYHVSHSLLASDLHSSRMLEQFAINQQQPHYPGGDFPPGMPPPAVAASDGLLVDVKPDRSEAPEGVHSPEHAVGF